MVRQDGPLLVGGLNENTNVAKPLLVNDLGELIVTTSGGGGTSDVNLTEVGGVAVSLGQKAMAASLPVVIASNQTAVPISAASLPLPSGAATAALQTQPGVDIGDVTVNNAAGAAAVNIQDGGNSITVDGAVSVTQTTSPWIVAGGGTAGTAASGVATIQGIASMTPVQVSQATAASLNAQVVGSIAHDAADSGNPVKVGAKAIAYGANPTDVASGDRTDLYANVAGIQFVIAGHPNALTILANYTSAQTNTAIVTAAGGVKIVALSCTIAADHANTVDVQARCGFATATTPTTTSVYISHPGIAPGSGIREAGAVAGADGEDFRITSEVPTGGSIDVVFKYFTVAA